MIKDIHTTEEYEKILLESEGKPVFVLKHSTSCPISANALRDFKKFAEDGPTANFYRVLVIEDRPLSNAIEDDTGIRHESPQVILYNDREPVWSESHWSIRKKSLQEALSQLA